MPVDQLAKISRYVGAGGEHPPLSKLGGTRWETMKARARRAAQELAGELLNLYAERRRRRGFAFPPDSDWLREFETAFPYRETPDQREAIEHVKWDMEAERPMDRLICGDVGYGKTEVALRAAFKAANAGKQVLMLVPTTILAQQHFGTFTERLRDYPFTIEHVSRFRPPAEQRAAVKAFSEGKTDILIGTHRLLSRDVRAKDLGLLIVDEEQRFGVKQKDLLRQLRLKVDVISMSATPIPRTLQMSLAGIRDISVIETPPEGRRPVKTYVGEYDEGLVKQALEREKARERPGLLPPQPDRGHRRDRRAPARAVPGHALHRRARADGREAARGADDRVPARRGRRARLDVDHRVRHRHPAGQHADRRALGHLRPVAALPDPRARRPLARARLRVPALPERGGADRGGRQPPLRALRLHRARAPASRSPCATSSCAAPATCSATSSPATSPRSASSSTCRCSTRRCARWATARSTRRSCRSPCASTSTSTPTSRPTTSPTSRPRSTSTAGSPARARSSELAELRAELSDRFGDPPEPLENLITLQQARIKLGQAGARAVTFRQGRLAVTPIELDSVRAKQLRAEIPGALYESGKSQLSVRVPDDPAERFPAVVRAADALLAVSSRLSEP